MIKICQFLILFLSYLFLSPCCYAQKITNFPDFNKNDRVLILSPHPDDETIGAAGAIQKAKEAGASVNVVWLTNGDNNELAFIAYTKKLVITKKSLLRMGELRRLEAIYALNALGVGREDLIFLGYPDFGTLNIFYGYWGETRPFKSMLTRVTQVPYPESPSYRKLFVGENILEDFESILKKYRPTKIFVTMSSDTNPDHRAIGLFLQVALWDLEGSIAKPDVFSFIVHARNWPMPKGFKPKLALQPPRHFLNDSVEWKTLQLSTKEIDAKKHAIAQYKSQNAVNPWYLYSFARRNELFGNQPVIDFGKDQDLNWQKIDDSTRIEGRESDDEKSENKNIEAISYLQNNGRLFIRIRLKTLKSEVLKTHLFLFGYKKDVPFAQMPKLRFIFHWPFEMVILDKKHPVFVKGVWYRLKSKIIELSVPLNTLNNPDFILTSASTWARGLDQDVAGWQILKLKK